ncbi:XRE family transcriptional regulator [Streptomyces sp. NPDC058045]|uniref:XRE family transcriptional regulator n=1 Tax=Streptomyces sp. NPDC058045 TaxID=3346311 RepID=UPI0036E995AF
MTAEGTAQDRSGGEPTRADLSELVRNRMEELGLSLRAVAKAAVDPDRPDDGSVWPHSSLESLAKGRKAKAPSESQLRALAAALRVPFLAVQQAAGAQFFGYVAERWSDDRKRRVFLARIHEMTDAEFAKLDQLAEILLSDRPTGPDEES